MELPSDVMPLGKKRARFDVPEIALAALVISVVSLLVVPLPPAVLDLLLATNLAGSVALLLVSLYVSDPLRIATFPTILLLTTLFRLALNVSSTRLILLHGNAGEVIQAFGNFVVAGNYAVGAVIFLILSIIQFIVIAKGSERVAEVGARFALDAMPGKQMAIDAEHRAGSIDSAEAKKRRHHLTRESQFYGAMDGAMKFVKGDVIAGFLIVAINVLGGIAIGMSQRNLPLATALKRYTLLSIGDGLVAQIPSLVIATAAGILVTRVSAEDGGKGLGQELAAQLFGVPRALRVTAAFVLLLAVVPGFPALPFIFLAALFFVAGRRKATTPLRPSASATTGRGNAAQPFVPHLSPWALVVAESLVPLLEDELKGGEVKRPGLRAALQAARELLFRDLGVPLPEPDVSVEPTLPADSCVLLLHEVPAARLTLTGAPEQAGATVLQWALAHVQPRAAEFLGITETQKLLDQLEEIAPASVRQVVPKPVPVPLLTEVLRRLVEEGVGIRDLKRILEALSQIAATEKDPLNLSEFVRSQLRRSISHRLTAGSGRLRVLLLEPSVEAAVRSSVQRTAQGAFLTLSPAAARQLVEAVSRAHTTAGGVDALVTQPDVRRFVRKLVESELPRLPVVSYADLQPELRLEAVGRVALPA